MSNDEISNKLVTALLQQVLTNLADALSIASPAEADGKVPPGTSQSLIELIKKTAVLMDTFFEQSPMAPSD